LIDDEGVNEAMSEFITPLGKVASQLEKATMGIGFAAMQNPDEAAAAASDYLRMMGHVVFAYLFCLQARAALAAQKAGSADPFYTAKLQTIRFYFARLFPEAIGALKLAQSGSKAVMDTDAALGLGAAQ
jgi:hypothetical protein